MLWLACHLPWPAVSGGRRRELELITRLAHEYEIHLIAVSKTPEADRAAAHRLGEFCARVDVLAAEPADPAGGLVARHRCPAAAARVAEVLAGGQVDIVHVEGFYLMQHVPRDCSVPVVLVEQNVEFMLDRQRAAVAADATRRGALATRAEQTMRAELEAWGRAGVLAAVTPEDRQVMELSEGHARVALVPDGADHLPPPAPQAGEEPVRTETPVAVFAANFAYEPNVDAALWLCGEILPELRRSVPELKLRLVGNAPPEEVRRLAEELVEVTGRVPEVAPHLDAADVLLCPLRIGGGIKVKTIEGLRRGKAIVTTSVGAQGLSPEVRRAMLVADDVAGFAAAVARVIGQPDARRMLEARAARAGRGLASWDEAARALSELYAGTAARSALATASGRSAT